MLMFSIILILTEMKHTKILTLHFTILLTNKTKMNVLPQIKVIDAFQTCLIEDKNLTLELMRTLCMSSKIQCTEAIKHAKTLYKIAKIKKTSIGKLIIHMIIWLSSSSINQLKEPTSQLARRKLSTQLPEDLQRQFRHIIYSLRILKSFQRETALDELDNQLLIQILHKFRIDHKQKSLLKLT